MSAPKEKRENYCSLDKKQYIYINIYYKELFDF